MTNKNFSMVDGKRIGFAPNLTLRLHRSDSVSSPCRCRVFSILLLCLTLGVGQMWGTDETVTLNYEGTGTFPYNSDWTSDGSASSSYNHTTSGSTSAMFATTSNAYITYKNSLTNIKSVTFWHYRNSSNGTNPTITLQTSTDKSTWSDAKSVIPTIVRYNWNYSTITLDAAFTGYVRLKYSCTSAAQKFIDDVTITYEGSSKSDLTLGLSYSPNPIILGEDASSSPTLTGNTGNGTVTYSLEDVSPTGCMSINSSTGLITPSAVGTAKAVASVAETTNYKSGTKKCDVSIVKKYTVILGDDASSLKETTVGSGVTLPSRDGCTGYKFEGWSTTNNTNWTTTAPSIIKAGSYSPTADITLYPVYTKEEGSAATWNKVTTLDGITAGTYVIVSDGCALQNTAATSSPARNVTNYGVTISDNKITSTVSDAMKWSFTGTNTAMTIKSYANSNNYLFNTGSNSNTGVRVGTTSDTWTFEVNPSAPAFAMYDATKSRYCCSTINSYNDWRSYNSADASNYRDDGKIYLFKLSGGSTKYYISAPNCCTPLGSINGSVFLNQSFDPFIPLFLLILFSLCQRSFLQFFKVLAVVLCGGSRSAGTASVNTSTSNKIFLRRGDTPIDDALLIVIQIVHSIHHT